MVTKTFYGEHLWEKIITDPGYTLGKREQETLLRFTPIVAQYLKERTNFLHLGIGVGREILTLLTELPQPKVYLLNDIDEQELLRTLKRVRGQYTLTHFNAQTGDIERRGIIKELRGQLRGPTLVILVANSTIFSNRLLDGYLREAMRRNDYLLLTLEQPHSEMHASYLIDPVLQLLSRGNQKVTRKNTRCWYDWSDNCLKVICDDEVLLSAYKPSVRELTERMKGAGFKTVAKRDYRDIHMTASLWKRQ